MLLWLTSKAMTLDRFTVENSVYPVQVKVEGDVIILDGVKYQRVEPTGHEGLVLEKYETLHEIIYDYLRHSDNCDKMVDRILERVESSWLPRRLERPESLTGEWFYVEGWNDCLSLLTRTLGPPLYRR